MSLGYNGNPFLSKHVIMQKEGCDALRDGEQFRVYDVRGRCIGIYRYEKKRGQFRLEKMFLDQDELRRQP